MKQRLTPNYDHEKIANPSLADLIDVFEDAWKGYILFPAKVLLNIPNHDGDLAAVTLLNSYFESIEELYQGKSSKHNSRKFFIAGFLRVFEKVPGLKRAEKEIIAKAIYEHVRCGAVHTGFPTHKVRFQREKRNAFLLTYPRSPDGQLDTKLPVESILVNAERIHDAVVWHLDQYVKALRQIHETTLQGNFNRLMRSSWGIGEGGNVVGMTEEEFANPI